MPVQTPQWTDVLCCCICYNLFDGVKHQPISLVCAHTACRACLLKLKSKQCPFDQSAINIAVADLVQNSPILKILDVATPNEEDKIRRLFEVDDGKKFKEAVDILESLTVYLKRAVSEKGGSIWSPQLSRPMQKKLVHLICCNLIEPEGRSRALKAVRSFGERSLTELLLMHQNPYHLSSNLWATVRARGCQFLGPAMQEEVLKLVLLALSEGALISRKVLVMYIVQTLEKEYPQASKTSVGHVVQLLYRASCFNVIKREAESSLMQLKEDFRTYESLRREHDSQIVQIAMEAGLRISPDQWSALLYGDQVHKSHMQSIIDRLQTPQSFFQCIQELLIGLQRTGDPGHLMELRGHFEALAEIDPSQGENFIPSWSTLVDALKCARTVVDGQVKFCEKYGGNRYQRDNVERNVVAYKFKTSMCRDIGENKLCPRGETCTFAHSLEEMERYRARSRLMGYRSNSSTARQGSDFSEETSFADADEDFDEKEFERIGRNICKWDSQMPSIDIEAQKKFGYPPPSLMGSASMMPTQPFMTPIQQIQQVVPPDVKMLPIATTAGSGIPTMRTMLAPPAPAAVMQQQPNMAFAPMPFLNQPIPQFGAVRYQILRPNTNTPTQVTSQIHPPMSVTTAPEFGYYWYPPTGANFPTRSSVSGEILHLEVPLARVVTGPPHVHPGFAEYLSQQTYSPNVETIYMYPSNGIPVRFDESLYVPQIPAAVAIAQQATGTYIHQRSSTDEHEESAVQVISSNYVARGEPADVSFPTANKDKKGKLQSLEKKREEILTRLEGLTKNQHDHKHSAADANTGVSSHISSFPVLSRRDEYSTDSMIVTNSTASIISSCMSKDTLVPKSSMPILMKQSSKKVQRSLSSEDNGRAKQANLYSPWNSTFSHDVSNSSTVIRHDELSASNGSVASSISDVSSVSNCKFNDANGPYFPDDYLDIKKLSDDDLKRELQKLPPTSKRSYYVRLEIESRELECCWRSDDDQVIPFSGDPHVSRYGPIARSRVAALTYNSLVVSPPHLTTSLPNELVYVKDTIHQPLPTAVVVQTSKDLVATAVRTSDPSAIDVSSIPIVFQASVSTMDPSTVGEKLDRVVEMKEKLECLPLIDGSSSVEREQLKIDLEIINKEIASLHTETEVECLLKELESVNMTIEELQN